MTSAAPQAFPYNEPGWHDPGMSLRDYFAAKVLQGACASALPANATPSEIAKTCYKMADAMLKARGSQP